MAINYILFYREYPGFKAVGPENRTHLGPPSDKQNFVKLIEELRTAFKPHGYVLSAGVRAGKASIDISYDVKRLSQLLDFISVMSYDFHGGWENKTGQTPTLLISIINYFIYSTQRTPLCLPQRQCYG